MNSALDLFTAQRRDHALNLSPVAEATYISSIATSFRPAGRFEACIVPISVHEIGRVGERRTTMNEETLHPTHIGWGGLLDCGRSSSINH